MISKKIKKMFMKTFMESNTFITINEGADILFKPV